MRLRHLRTPLRWRPRKSRMSQAPRNFRCARPRQLASQSDTYYAKSSEVDGVYKINSDLGQALDKGVDDFRNKKLFDFGFADPNKIELHIGSKAYFLTRSGEDWWQDGKKMDAGTVQSLISKLRDFTADKFLDSGFANPTIDVTVTSDDGKRVEKVLIAKSNDAYLAKRENDPALYQLNSRYSGRSAESSRRDQTRSSFEQVNASLADPRRVRHPAEGAV